uniref:Uncharacterized protein n=2 Tax=Cannabis sativa TaxID=3483 RepID=A0A803NNI6_CANSA
MERKYLHKGKQIQANGNTELMTVVNFVQGTSHDEYQKLSNTMGPRNKISMKTRARLEHVEVEVVMMFELVMGMQEERVADQFVLEKEEIWVTHNQLLRMLLLR